MRVETVHITTCSISLDGCPLTPEEEWYFAKADGFASPQDLFDWFNQTHALPFSGIAIFWSDKFK